MDLLEFFAAHHADWPIGKLHTLHQTQELAVGEPITHPLLADEFVKSADLIRLTVQGPKTLSRTAIKRFMQQVASVVPENAAQEFEIRLGVSNECILVSILAATSCE